MADRERLEKLRRLKELRDKSGIASPVQAAAPQEIEQPEEPGIIDRAIGGLETAATVASGAIAEPLAGLAGIAQAANPFADPGAGAKAVEATREALTFQPKTETGQESLQAVGEFIQPVGEAFSQAETFLGDKTLEATGSPALAAAAATIPTALTELLGFAAGKGAVRAGKAAKETKLIQEIGRAAPTIDDLKNTTRAVFTEIDDLGATVKPQAYRSLVRQIRRETSKRGLDPDITPKAAKALDRIERAMGSELKTADLDRLRTIAQNAADSIDRPEKMLGSIMIDKIDTFLDDAGARALNVPEGVNVGKRYKVARDLWGRARRSEMIGEAVEKAREQASGFENGLRTQFRQILSNKNKKKFFKKAELNAMRQVVQGTPGANLAKTIGRLGFSEGAANNILGGAAGAAAGGVVGGAPGAVLVPVVGQVSRKLAQRLTEGNARFADQVIRAGKDAKKIARAYLDNTPENLRNSAELSELLMQPDINLLEVGADTLSRQAANIARDRIKSLSGAATAGALTPETQEQGLLQSEAP